MGQGDHGSLRNGRRHDPVNLQPLQLSDHIIKGCEVGAVHRLLGSAQLLGQRGIHVQIGAAALAAPQALLGNTLSQTLHGTGTKFLCTAMGTDLDVRHVLLQRLVLPCRAAQRIVFRLYGGELLLQGLYLLLQMGIIVPKSGILLRQETQCVVLSHRIVALTAQRIIFSLQHLQRRTVLLGGFFDKRDHILTVEAAEHTRLEAGIHGKYLLSRFLVFSIPQILPSDKRMHAKMPPYIKLKQKSPKSRFTNASRCCIL